MEGGGPGGGGGGWGCGGRGGRQEEGPEDWVGGGAEGCGRPERWDLSGVGQEDRKAELRMAKGTEFEEDVEGARI